MKCFFPMSCNIFRKKGEKATVKIIGGDNNGNSKLPCGKCIGCRLNYSSEWGVRCYLESTLYKWNFFITLTYADEYLKFKFCADENGEAIPVKNLVASDLTAFIKKLRQHYKRQFNHDGIRFYACGEYGDRTYRPHFHIVFFNLPIDDLKFYKRSFTNDNYFNSKTIENIWGKGHCVIANLTYDSAAYTARYVMKKQLGKSAGIIDKYGVDKEFVRMSRMPGIGKGYFDKNYEKIYRDDEVLVPTKKGVRSFSPPKYFDDLYEKIDSDRLFNLKDKRLKYIESANYGLSSDEILSSRAAEHDSLRSVMKFVRDTDKK